MNMNELISYRLERAKETIDEAEQMAIMEHWNACVNRLYYACFYATNALLLSKNYSSSKHAGVRSLLNRHFVKSQIIPKELGKLYNVLFEYRQQTDYEDLFQVDKELVKPWITLSKDFVYFIEKLITDDLSKKDER